MDAENCNMGSSKMAFPIDLNEIPTSSPRGAVHNAVGGSAAGVSISICPLCRKGVSVGRITDKGTEEQRLEDKCFRCLLKNDAAGSSSSSGTGVGMGRLDINAPPPSEVGDAEDVVFVGRWDGGKVPASVRSSLHQLSDGNSGAVYRESTSNMGPRPTHFTPSEFSLESPRSLYLQTLREFIAQRSGILVEGWGVEFEFCNKSYKTSAVYIAPDGIKCKTMEEVARQLGLPSWSHSFKAENGRKDFAFFRSGSKIDLPNKDFPPSLTALNCRPSNNTLRDSSSQDFLPSSGIICSSDNGSQWDNIHDGYPIQFQNFCLVSAGIIDPRPSYHNASQIWPVGYRCSWHDRVTGSLFVCDVTDGGDCGPLFKVWRYPCTSRSLPFGSTILSKLEYFSYKEDHMVAGDDSSSFQMPEDDNMSTVTLLNEDSPPCLDSCLSSSKREDSVHNSQDDNFSNSDLDISQRNANTSGEAVSLGDMVGEFQVEGSSTSSVWERVSQTFVYACRELFNQKGVVKLFCSHEMHGIISEKLDSCDPLSKFGCFGSLTGIPALVQSENELHVACEKLLKWLNQDRFGLDADFVQEIIEQLPGVGGCSEYKNLNDREFSNLHTVGSGFFQVERRTNSTSGTSKRYRVKFVGTEGILYRDPCPPGKPLKFRFPTYLMGDALQVWEMSWRFLEVFGLESPLSFAELESELVSPWLDNCSFDSRHETVNTRDEVSSSTEKASQRGSASLDRGAGHLLVNIYMLLLKLLVGELLSKVAVYACPISDSAESRPRRGRKKDLDSLAASNKRKMEIMPVNVITWQEIARRYILAVLSMKGSLDRAEAAYRESGKIFHCLQGDGGVLSGSLTGIAALEGDALVFADAMKEIFGSLKSKNEIVTVCERDSVSTGAQILEMSDNVVPEWAQVLEPVRKLPTNVGARIRRCINEALERNPPEWAKKILEHSISKEVYKGNASGPTKRAVISVLANVSNDNPQQNTETKEKVKIKINLIDLITKQCRIVLRRAACFDEDRVFCNLLARIMLNPGDNDDEGILGYPAMVSRPIDFRTIDLRLEFGAYGGSHETFFDDVQEVWRNINTAYGDRSDLIDLANKLFKKFEDLFEEEVLTLVQKIAEASNADDSSANGVKERDDLLLHVFNTSLPRAPWEDGVCKVCGMDKDDDNVLLCDKCDSEYHRYCLNPPLQRIPDGNWYCPSCITGQSVSSRTTYASVANQYKKRRNLGEHTCKFGEDLARAANLMEIKEFWEFTIEERIFLLKFLFDEALNTACMRDHMDQCVSQTADLQQKLRSLASELKLLKVKEEIRGLSVEKQKSALLNMRGDLKSDESASSLSFENSSRARPTEKSNNLSPSSDSIMSNTLNQFQDEKLVEGYANESLGHTRLNQSDMLPSQDGSVEMESLKKDILDLQNSIASTELELLKVSLRKDFLGRDSNGRVYWAFFSPGARPWIMACGDLISNDRPPEEFIRIHDSNKWMSYESDHDIAKLVMWLRENNLREKELRESILQFQCNKLNNPEYTENHLLSRGQSQHDERKHLTSTEFLATKATAALENKYGPCSETDVTRGDQNSSYGLSHVNRMYRCECLELLWPTKIHCPSCHQSFPTIEELNLHSADNCKAAPSFLTKCQGTEDISSHKKPKPVASQEKQSAYVDSPKILVGGEEDNADCPFSFQEIMARFTVPGSVKDAVNEIGLIGTGGIPSFLPGDSPYLSDPALSLGPSTVYEYKNLNQDSSDEASAMASKTENKESQRLSRLAETEVVEEGSVVDRLKSISMVERHQLSCGEDKSSLLGVSKSSRNRESSSRPLVGKASEVLRFLKINLLDMDAALPEDALRTSRSNQGKRRAWRAYVKSSRSIYEMVRAMVILEDAIKSEYLRNEWWYWSSPSTAAKITTLSALALRIYSLDAAICYDKPLSNAQTEIPVPDRPLNEEAPPDADQKNTTNSSPVLQKNHEQDTSENLRTRSRATKRKRD